MNLPARDEGEHLCVGGLVAADAILMLSFQPYLGGTHQRSVPIESALSTLEEGIWRWLATGWARVRDDHVLVYWHPAAEDWVPFSRSLHDYYTEVLGVGLSRLKRLQEERRQV